MARQRTSAKIIQIIFVGSLLLPWIATYLLTLSQERYWLHFNYGLICFAVAGYVAIQSLARRGKNIDWVLSVAVLNLLVLTPELFLRQANFHYETGVQFGYPKPAQFEAFVPDKDLFWKLPPQKPGVNSLGFEGKEIEVPKPAGIYRILFLGDSVPRQGYPAMVETFLNAQPQRKNRFECINLSMSGYSTYQGRILVDKYGTVLEPDLVLVSYGWNDHWQAYGQIDSKKTITVSWSAADTVYKYSRVLQWLRYRLSPLIGIEHPLSEARVPPDEYRANLTYIGTFFTTRHVPVIFITPPTAQYSLGVPDYLVKEGFAANKESVVTLHRAYNQIVREVTTAHHWPILDLEQEFASLDNLADIFIEDGIHLTPIGLGLVAKRVTDFIVTQ